MLKGSCLCGGVKYEIKGEPIIVAHCHCIDCQDTVNRAHPVSDKVLSCKAQNRSDGEVLLQVHDSAVTSSAGHCHIDEDVPVTNSTRLRFQQVT